MLIFKNNIYDLSDPSLPGRTPSPDIEYDRKFDPRSLLNSALGEEDETLDFIERQYPEYRRMDLQKFYPCASRFGDVNILRDLLRILRDGLNEPDTWYHMNTYHFCLLYDVLIRFSFNYNHDNRQERLRALPELDGKPLFIDLFVKDYFFNTVFLLDEDKFNDLSAQEKSSKGYDFPCLFSVINGLLPTREEMELEASTDYPYSIYV